MNVYVNKKRRFGSHTRALFTISITTLFTNPRPSAWVLQSYLWRRKTARKTGQNKKPQNGIGEEQMSAFFQQEYIYIYRKKIERRKTTMKKDITSTTIARVKTWFATCRYSVKCSLKYAISFLRSKTESSVTHAFPFFLIWNASKISRSLCPGYRTRIAQSWKSGAQPQEAQYVGLDDFS